MKKTPKIWREGEEEKNKKVERTSTKKIGTKKTYSEENILRSVCICGG